MSCVYFAERNIHGAWVVYGGLGIRQYYGYTKKEALRRYKDEYHQKGIENED